MKSMNPMMLYSLVIDDKSMLSTMMVPKLSEMLVWSVLVS